MDQNEWIEAFDLVLEAFPIYVCLAVIVGELSAYVLVGISQNLARAIEGWRAARKASITGGEAKESRR